MGCLPHSPAPASHGALGWLLLPPPVPPRVAGGWERGPGRVEAVQPRPGWDGRSLGGSGSRQRGGLGGAGHTQQRARGGRQHHSSPQAPSLALGDTRQSLAISPERPLPAPQFAYIYWGPRRTTAGLGRGGKGRELDSPVPCTQAVAGNGQGGTSPSRSVPGTAACRLPGAGRELSARRVMSPAGPPRAKAFPAQPGAAPGLSSGYVGGCGAKLGCGSSKLWVRPAGTLAQLRGGTQGRGAAHLDGAAGQPAFCCRASLCGQPQARSSTFLLPACARLRCSREGQAGSSPSSAALQRGVCSGPFPTQLMQEPAGPLGPRRTHSGSFTSDLQLGLALLGAVLVDSLAGVEAGVGALRRQDVQCEEPSCPLCLLRVMPAAVLHGLPVPQPARDTGRAARS